VIDDVEETFSFEIESCKVFTETLALFKEFQYIIGRAISGVV